MTVTNSSSLQSLIHAIDQAGSSEQLISAVQALATARQEAGIPTLIRALGFNNAGAAAIAVRGLVEMGTAAVQPLLELLDDYNYGARAWAIRALVGIGDPRALEVLLAAAEADFAPSVRRAATKGLGFLQWQLLPDEQVALAQKQVLESLLKITEDSDWSLRYAGIVGLQALALALPSSPEAIIRLQQMSETDTDRAVQARSRMALKVLADAS
jgi:phycocyanobilin lyase beta subunit